jgi:hypothetical protein
MEMYTDRLKRYHKRNNPTEQSVMCSIIDRYPDLSIIKGKNIVNLNWCAKEYKGQNVLIVDIKNTNLTYNGRYRTTEFCFIHHSGKITWIDAKQAKTATNITDLHGEYDRATNNKQCTVFVVDGNGYSTNVIEAHETYLKKLNINDKIKIIPLAQIQNLTHTFFN